MSHQIYRGVRVRWCRAGKKSTYRRFIAFQPQTDEVGGWERLRGVWPKVKRAVQQRGGTAAESGRGQCIRTERTRLRHPNSPTLRGMEDERNTEGRGEGNWVGDMTVTNPEHSDVLYPWTSGKSCPDPGGHIRHVIPDFIGRF